MDVEIILVIPSKGNENREARPVEFDREAYRNRNIVERFIGRLKENRRIFSRFKKTANLPSFRRMLGNTLEHNQGPS